MHAAHRLYRRLGFEFVPERDWVIEEPPIHLLGVRFQL
jgi:ribosomal protein S18 acetylase RimI-like enzyme